MAIFSAAMAIGGLLASLINQIPPGAEFVSQSTFKLIPNRIPNIAECILLYYRGLIDKTQYQELCKRNGFENDLSLELFESQKKLLSEGDLVAAWRRGIITEDDLNKNLVKHQYTENDINNIKRVTEFYPSPPDLIRFAVREVYTPETKAIYGMDKDFPSEFLQAAAKAGLNSEQAVNYWAAHWELPSINQGFEMLHRGVISQEELNTLLKSLDVMPFWRDKLTQISYNPLTRVDVRRMYSLGVLDKEGVKRAYLDIGYNESNADLMTDFTIKYESNEDAGLTRSSIINAYKKDLITQDQFLQYMKRLGYTESIINFYGELTEYEKYEEQVDGIVENVIQLYELGNITLSDVRTVLTGLDLPTVFIDSTINKLKIKSAVKTKIPSKTDVENWLKLQVINDLEYATYMKRQGYEETDIIKYLEEIGKEIDISQKVYQPVKTYQRWLTLGIMSESLFVDTLQEMKVRQSDISNYIAEYKQSQNKQG